MIGARISDRQKHLDCSTTVAPSLDLSHVIVRRAPERTRSASADIASIVCKGLRAYFLGDTGKQ